MNEITVKKWNQSQFLSSEAEWNNLLSRSQSDPLFMSWEWQSTWWSCFSEKENMTLEILAAYTKDKRLVGIAPLYIKNSRTHFSLSSKRLQFIGNCWRDKGTMRTELLDFITDNALSDSVNMSFFDYIRYSMQWDELILAELPTSSATWQTLQNHSITSVFFTRIAERYKSYYLPTQKSFSEYLASLGKNTRLRIYNKRKRLNSLKNILLKNIEDIDRGFNILDRLHQLRWQRPAFKNDRLRFNKKIAALLSDKDQLRFSSLSINGNIAAIQYNYIVKGTLYNIQSGFDEKFDKKLPLGYLHFGYEIEYAFDNHLTKYNFLAGHGKTTNYKLQTTFNRLQY